MDAFTKCGRCIMCAKIQMGNICKNKMGNICKNIVVMKQFYGMIK